LENKVNYFTQTRARQEHREIVLSK